MAKQPLEKWRVQLMVSKYTDLFLRPRFYQCLVVVDTPVSKSKHNQHACIDLTPIEWYYYSATTLFFVAEAPQHFHTGPYKTRWKTAEDCMYFPVPPFSGGYSVQKLWHQHCVVVLRMAPMAGAGALHSLLCTTEEKTPIDMWDPKRDSNLIPREEQYVLGRQLSGSRSTNFHISTSTWYKYMDSDCGR